MLKRIITALVLLLIFVPALVFSHTIAFPIAAVALSVVGVFEMLKCLGFGKSKSMMIPSLLLATVIPLGTVTFYYEIPAIPATLHGYLTLAFSCCFFYMLYMFAAGLVFRGTRRFSDIATSILMALYVIFSFTSVVLLRQQPHGVFLVYLVFVCPLLTDVFAYFTGIFLGRHKLLPEISPKKTVEGCIGGTVFGSLSCLLFGFIVSVIAGAFPETFETLTPNYAALAVNGLIVSIFSQVGDLTTSWIKREHGVKDFGKIFPGHGGVLDRFDSVLLTAPIILMFSTFSGSMVMFL